MAKGTFKNYPVSDFGLNCSWWSTPDILTNSSKVTVQVWLSHAKLTAAAMSGCTIKCGNETHTYTSPKVTNSDNILTLTELETHTFTVKHNANGSKQVALSATWKFNGTYAGTYVGTITATTTATLDNIPRQSSISSVTSNVEVNGTNKVTVNISRADTSFTHSVKFSIGSYSNTATSIGTSTSYAIQRHPRQYGGFSNCNCNHIQWYNPNR